MYEHPTYIPELGTNIVAYGVMEENIPLLKDCFKYGGDKQHRRLHSGPPYFPVGGSAMMSPKIVNPLTMKGWNINSISAHSTTNTTKTNWICEHCGGDTSQVEYDYLFGTNHLSCEMNRNLGGGNTI
jgi:hypothetical protein